MMIRTSLALIVTLTAQVVPAQTFELPPQSGSSFEGLSRSYYDWKGTANLDSVNGWKAFARWLHFNESRLDPDGTMPDPTILYNEAIRIAQLKQANPHRITGWFPIGPDESVYNRLGRYNCIAFHPTDSNIFWVGVAQGGVWKTVDHGQSWMPLTDDLPILRISDIAVDPSDPNTLYICVGDYAYLGVGLDLDGRDRNTHYGLGVYKTTDGGATWLPTGLSFEMTQRDESLMRRIFVDPNNSSRLVAAGISGIWRSDDAGVSWSQIVDTLIADFEMDPSNPNVLYASSQYVSNLGRGRAGILKSSDFGNTWTWLTTPIPPFLVERTELTVSRSDPNYIYAVSTNLNKGLYAVYRSTNGGTTWATQFTNPPGPNLLGWDNSSGSSGQGWYDLCILVDANDRDRVYVGGVNLWGSTNGGQTWDGISYWADNYQLTSCHADLHQLKYNPLDQQVYLCNDGGLVRTREVEIGSWADRDNIPGYVWPTVWDDLSQNLQVTSFYRLGVCESDPAYVVAGAQDNSTFYFNDPNWENVIGGDGMECAIQPDDPWSVVGSSQYGRIVYYNASVPYSADLDMPNEGSEWTTPFTFNSTWSSIYYGLRNLWRADDVQTGLPYTQLSNFTNPAVISHFNIAPSDPDVIYVAKRIDYFAQTPAEVWYTGDEGSNWTNVTAGLPDSLYPNYITIDDDNPVNAWIVFGGFVNGVKVFRTTDAGQTWQNITWDLPNIPVNCIAHHPGAQDNRVYIGTDIGVWFASDDSTQWTLYAEDLPNVIVTELEPHVASNTLFASTFGRGLWAVDMPTFDTTVLPGVATIPEAGLTITPNPARDIINVKVNLPAGALEISIVDVLGREVFRSVINHSGGYGPYALHPDLKPGAYFVKVSCNGRTWSERVLIQ